MLTYSTQWWVTAPVPPLQQLTAPHIEPTLPSLHPTDASVWHLLIST